MDHRATLWFLYICAVIASSSVILALGSGDVTSQGPLRSLQLEVPRETVNLSRNVTRKRSLERRGPAITSEDVNQEDKPRGKRTLGLFLQGLAQALGFRTAPVMIGTLPNPALQPAAAPGPLPLGPSIPLAMTTARAAPPATPTPKLRETFRITGVLNFGNNSNLLGHLQQYEQMFHGGAPPQTAQTSQDPVGPPVLVKIPFPFSPDLPPPLLPAAAAKPEDLPTGRPTAQGGKKGTPDLLQEHDFKEIQKAKLLIKKPVSSENSEQDEASKEKYEDDYSKPYEEYGDDYNDPKSKPFVEYYDPRLKPFSDYHDPRPNPYVDYEDPRPRPFTDYPNSEPQPFIDYLDPRPKPLGDYQDPRLNPLGDYQDSRLKPSADYQDSRDNPYDDYYNPQPIPYTDSEEAPRGQEVPFEVRLPIREDYRPSAPGKIRNSYGESLENGGHVDESIADYLPYFRRPNPESYDYQSAAEVPSGQGDVQDEGGLPDGHFEDYISTIRNEYAIPGRRREDSGKTTEKAEKEATDTSAEPVKGEDFKDPPDAPEKFEIIVEDTEQTDFGDDSLENNARNQRQDGESHSPDNNNQQHEGKSAENRAENEDNDSKEKSKEDLPDSSENSDTHTRQKEGSREDQPDSSESTVKDQRRRSKENGPDSPDIRDENAAEGKNQTYSSESFDKDQGDKLGRNRPNLSDTKDKYQTNNSGEEQTDERNEEYWRRNPEEDLANSPGNTENHQVEVSENGRVNAQGKTYERKRTRAKSARRGRPRADSSGKKDGRRASTPRTAASVPAGQRMLKTPIKEFDFLKYTPYYTPIQYVYRPEDLIGIMERIRSYSKVGPQKNGVKYRNTSAKPKQDELQIPASIPLRSTSRQDELQTPVGIPLSSTSKQDELQASIGIPLSSTSKQDELQTPIGIPLRSTSTLLHEGEGRVIQAWPPPFDYAFDSTEQSKVAQPVNSHDTTTTSTTEINQHTTKNPPLEKPDQYDKCPEECSERPLETSRVDTRGPDPLSDTPETAPFQRHFPENESLVSSNTQYSSNEHLDHSNEKSDPPDCPEDSLQPSQQSSTSTNLSKYEYRIEARMDSNDDRNTEMEITKSRITEIPHRSTSSRTRVPSRRPPERGSKTSSESITSSEFREANTFGMRIEGNSDRQQEGPADVSNNAPIRTPKEGEKLGTFDDPLSAHDYFGFSKNDYDFESLRESPEYSGSSHDVTTIAPAADEPELLTIPDPAPYRYDESLTEFTVVPESDTERIRVKEFRNKVATLKVSELERLGSDGPIRLIGYSRNY